MSTDFVNIPSTGEANDNDDIVVDDTAGGVLLLPANPNRMSALIINVGAEPMRVTTDGTAPTPTHGKLIPAGAALNLSSPGCPGGEVKAVRQGANGYDPRYWSVSGTNERR